MIIKTKASTLFLFTCIRQYTAICTILIASLLLSCSMEPTRERPYVYLPSLWGSWSIQGVWYYGDEDTCYADGTGTLQLKSFGEKFGDEHYSLDFEITVPLPSGTIVITKTENGIYYVELDIDEQGNNKIYFFPDSGPDWHSTFYFSGPLTLYTIPVTGGTLYIDWQKIE